MLVVPPEIQVLPPVQRGDVERLYKAESPGVLIVVDGLFHQNLAVAHVEIREALAAGWRIWGLSSMGAIRASEMLPLGMRGWGDVFQHFVGEEFEDFQDDEVTLLHEPAPSYRPVTEPLVHLRVAADALVQAGHLTPTGCCAVIERLKSLWYGERTLSLFGQLLRVGEIGVPAEVVADLLQKFDQYRIKTHDLERFLQAEVWREATC